MCSFLRSLEVSARNPKSTPLNELEGLHQSRNPMTFKAASNGCKSVVEIHRFSLSTDKVNSDSETG